MPIIWHKNWSAVFDVPHYQVYAVTQAAWYWYDGYNINTIFPHIVGEYSIYGYNLTAKLQMWLGLLCAVVYMIKYS